jgi:hypothetical protein
VKWMFSFPCTHDSTALVSFVSYRNQQQQQQQQHNVYQNSPQMNAYGMPPTRATSGGRAYSFEESMLPPSAALGQHDQGNPAYSPYGESQGSPGGTLFALPQPWGYGPPPDMYDTSYCSSADGNALSRDGWGCHSGRRWYAS